LVSITEKNLATLIQSVDWGGTPRRKLSETKAECFKWVAIRDLDKTLSLSCSQPILPTTKDLNWAVARVARFSNRKIQFG
jgi:hypothetical protein